MPKETAVSAAGKASIKDRSPSGRIQGSEGMKVRLAQYARKVDQALRDLLGAGPGNALDSGRGRAAADRDLCRRGSAPVLPATTALHDRSRSDERTPSWRRAPVASLTSCSAKSLRTSGPCSSGARARGGPPRTSPRRRAPPPAVRCKSCSSTSMKCCPGRWTTKGP